MGLGYRQGWKSLYAGAALMLLLALLATELPAAGRRDDPDPVPHGPVYTITLPDAAPTLPPGPHQPQFQAVCRLCHSPRLVLTQPRFPEKKWAEIVHKMVTVYHAPIQPEQERDIVSYLVAIRGTEP
jgi:hypothetical protein